MHLDFIFSCTQRNSGCGQGSGALADWSLPRAGHQVPVQKSPILRSEHLKHPWSLLANPTSPLLTVFPLCSIYTFLKFSWKRDLTGEYCFKVEATYL